MRLIVDFERITDTCALIIDGNKENSQLNLFMILRAV
jgi:hypothetical protein